MLTVHSSSETFLLECKDQNSALVGRLLSTAATHQTSRHRAT
jgi:hypothetical protein